MSSPLRQKGVGADFVGGQTPSPSVSTKVNTKHKGAMHMLNQLMGSIEKLAGVTAGVQLKEGLEIGLGVEHFSIEMAARMLMKQKEGFAGWNDPTIQDDVEDRLLAKAALVKVDMAEAKDLIDIANYAMILWTRQNQMAPKA